jgi:hypothetical protein
MNNAIRNGNFTSSEIVALVSNDKSGQMPGAPYHTYIKECNMERKLGRSLTGDVDAKPLSWGRLNEKRVHELLGTAYEYCSSKTLSHPTVECWKGSPDHIFHHPEEGHYDAVCDVKCPHTLKSFCELVDAGLSGGIEAIRKTKYGEKYYWQLVSNACITGHKYAELIVYAPYQPELSAIKQLADGDPRYYWIQFANDDELPFLIEGGHYKNLNIFRFQVPSKDKMFLHSRVEMAAKELIEFSIVQQLEHAF